MVLDVEREVAERSILIKNMIEDMGEEVISDVIPIPNVRCSLQKSNEGQRLTVRYR